MKNVLMGLCVLGIMLCHDQITGVSGMRVSLYSNSVLQVTAVLAVTAAPAMYMIIAQITGQVLSVVHVRRVSQSQSLLEHVPQITGVEGISGSGLLPW